MTATAESSRPTGRVVVGVDGSPESTHALRVAADEARMRDAVLEVVHVWAPPIAGSPIGPIIVPLHEEIYHDAHRSLLDAVVDQIRQGSAPPEGVVPTLVRDTSAARGLLDAAKDADLLVVGSRGRGGFVGLVLGSVSQHCVHHATCPVLVVRGTEEGADHGSR